MIMIFDIQRFATQKDQSVHSGNTIILKARGTIIGRAQSLDGRRSFGTEGVYEIGSIMPMEHINNRYEGTVTLERFLIKKSDLAKAGFAALGEEILARDIIDIEVLSKYDNTVVRVYRGCTAVDYSENFRVGAISGENATFQYLSCDRGSQDAELMNELYSGLNEMGQAYMRASNYSFRASDTSLAAASYYMYEGEESLIPKNPPDWITSASGASTTSGGNG